MGYGDELMAAGVAGALSKRLGGRIAILGLDDQPRWSSVWEHNPHIASPEQYRSGANVGQIKNGPHCRPYVHRWKTWQGRPAIGFTSWMARAEPGRIYLTEAELLEGFQLQASIGPFVVIEPQTKGTGSPNKLWSEEGYAEVVASAKHCTFIQLGPAGTKTLPGVEHIETATFREACSVLFSARAYIGTEGGLHHAAAALRIPGIVLFGGFISPMTTGYPGHINLYVDGPESPCGRWAPCPHCQKAMASITTQDVLDAAKRVFQEVL